jgi:putative transposase
VGRKQAHYKATGTTISYPTLAGEVVALKRQDATHWLKDCHAQVVQQTLKDLERAFTNFFEKRAKFPRFKNKKRTPHSMRFPQHVRVVDRRTVIIASIHRPLVGIVKGATVKQDATGAWWIVFVCHIERPDVAPTCANPVGIDLGLESFTTLHMGQKVAPPRFYRRGEKKLKKLARKLARAQPGSKRRHKAKQRLATTHQRIRNQRADWLHKHALEIIRHFDTVCIETLNIKGLAKTKLAKSFTNAALSTFMQMVGYKAEWYGTQIIKVGRFYASSKICHCCQHKTTLTLADRRWTCPTCGTAHDRDVNAAINILHEGLRILAVGTTERRNARGDRIRPGTPGTGH